MTRRDDAARHCFVAWGGVVISTGLIGLFPGMHLAWVFTGLSGVGSVRARRPDGLRQRALGRAGPAAPSRREVRSGAPQAEGLATAGYPGAWDDDDFEVPQAVAR